jgi:hypothetical protein
LFFWNALGYLQQCFGYMLAGVSEMKRLTIYSLLSTGLIAGLMALFVHPFGRDGVVTAMIIGFMPYLILGNIVESMRYFRRVHRPTETEAPLTEPIASVVEPQI